MRHSFLEDFSVAEQADLTTQISDIDDEKNLDIFEEGYKAGWEDALKTTDQEALHIRDEICSHILDQSFAYQESISRFSHAATAMIEEALIATMPKIAKDAALKEVIECTREFLKGSTSGQVLINTSNEQHKRLHESISRIFPEGVSFRSSNALHGNHIKIIFLDEEYAFDTEEYTRKLGEIVEESLARLSLSHEFEHIIQETA